MACDCGGGNDSRELPPMGWRSCDDRRMSDTRRLPSRKSIDFAAGEIAKVLLVCLTLFVAGLVVYIAMGERF